MIVLLLIFNYFYSVFNINNRFFNQDYSKGELYQISGGSPDGEDYPGLEEGFGSNEKPNGCENVEISDTYECVTSGDDYERILDSSVEIITRTKTQTGSGEYFENWQGSGTIIDMRDGYALIATAGHVLGKGEEIVGILVDFQGDDKEEYIPGTFKYREEDEDDDMGFISIKAPEGAVAAPLASKDFKYCQGMEVKSAGCGGGKECKIIQSYITGINEYPNIKNIAGKGMPAFDIVGLPSKAVAESRERVKTAIINSGFEFPNKKIIVNLAPADLPKEGSFYDLPIAAGILSAISDIEIPPKTLFYGELSLDGTLRHTKGSFLLAAMYISCSLRILATSSDGRGFICIAFLNSYILKV